MEVVDEEYRLYYYNSARLARRHGRYDLETLAWQNAVQLDPDDNLAKAKLERCLHDDAEMEEIIAELRQKLADEPDDVDLRYQLASNCLSQGRVAEAKAHWEQIAAMKRENWSKSARKMIRKHCWMPDTIQHPPPDL